MAIKKFPTDFTEDVVSNDDYFLFSKSSDGNKTKKLLASNFAIGGKRLSTNDFTDAYKTKVDNMSLVNDALVNGIFAYWDGQNNPTVGSNAYPTPTLSGVAQFIDSTNGIRLTPAQQYSSGSINWQFMHPKFTSIKFKLKAGGGSGGVDGADATWFYFFASSIPMNESYPCGGYIVAFSEYHDCIYLHYDGTKLAEIPLNGIDDNQWHTVKIIVLFNRIVAFWDGVKKLDFYDVYTRDKTKTYFGFGARTGWFHNNHYMRGLLVSKYNMNDNIDEF